MSKYTKAIETRQYSQVIYYRDGEEFARETLNDDHGYDIEPQEPMTADELEDWL